MADNKNEEINIEDLDELYSVNTSEEEEETILSPEGRNSKPERMRVEEKAADASRDEETKEAEDYNDSKVLRNVIRILMVAVPILVLAFMAFYYFYYRDVALPTKKYQAAISEYNKGNYEEAAKRFKAMGGYEKAEEYLAASYYSIAEQYYNQGDFEHAITYYEIADNYEDSDIKMLDCYYVRGKAAYDDGNYSVAMDYLGNAGAYKNAKSLYDICKLKSLHRLDEMDTVFFGRYPQSSRDAEEPIEWIIIYKDSEKALLLSRYILDKVIYSRQDVDNKWEDSEIRRWLNNEFLNDAFNEDEQQVIASEEQYTPINPVHGTGGGNPTTDKVFVLSADDATTYFIDKVARRTIATPYALERGVYANEIGTSLWWLREKGGVDNEAACVHFQGHVDFNGMIVDSDFVGVRPAIWLYFDN